MASWTFFIFVTILLCINNVRCNECIIRIKTEMLADSPIVASLFTENNPKTSTSRTHFINDKKILYPSDSWDQPGSAQDPRLLILKKDAYVNFICLPETSGKKDVNKSGVMTVKGEACTCSMKKVKCIGNNKFEISMNGRNEQVEFKDVKCAYVRNKKYTAILNDTGKTCEDMTPTTTPNVAPSMPDVRLFEILYDLGNGHYLKMIELCHDTRTSNTLWAHSFIVPENQDGFRFSDKKRPGFRYGNLFKSLNWIKPNKKMKVEDTETEVRDKIGGDTGPYSKMSQWKTARFLLGNADKADDYFLSVSESGREDPSKFLAKGHLVADGDKLYKWEQDNTYFFANVLPMWQSINANPGYWGAVESSIRLQSFAKKRKFLIWVGGIDILELPNAEGKEVEFFLDPINRTSTSDLLLTKAKKFNPDYQPINKMPVPRIIFKVVVDEEAMEALVFLVVNHPKLDPNEVNPKIKPKIPKLSKYMVCPNYVEADDPCRQDGGLLKDNNKQKHGYLYCCDLQNFYDEHAGHLGLKSRLTDYQSYAPLTLIENVKKPVY